VLITAGAAEANYLVSASCWTAGDEIITEAPGWPQAGVMAKAIGADGWWKSDGDEAGAGGWTWTQWPRAITPKTRMIFLTNPNNPTGA
jgi:aspartate/methionine/tyrosine aminotransferase